MCETEALLDVSEPRFVGRGQQTGHESCKGEVTAAGCIIRRESMRASREYGEFGIAAEDHLRLQEEGTH